MANPVKIYDRPADRRSPSVLFLVVAVLLLIAIGFLLYRRYVSPQAPLQTPTGTQSSITVLPVRDVVSSCIGKSAVA